MNRTVIKLDTSAFRSSGSTRGLGRYAGTLRSALHSLAEYEVVEMSVGALTRVAPERYREWFTCLSRSWHGAMARPSYIYHATSPYQLPLFSSAPMVCSVQDIIPIDFSGYTQTGVKAQFFHSLTRRCDAILVQSEHTRGRVVDRLGIDPESIFAAPLPISVDISGSDVPSLSGVPAKMPYIVALFDLRYPDPRKRLPLFLDVAKDLRNDGIAAVAIGSGTETLTTLDGWLLGLGRVSDPEMLSIYRRALCYLYTTAYEGQGLPPQEALSVGCPTVAVANSSIPEMLGPGALLVEESNELAELRQALYGEVVGLAESPKLRSELGRSGTKHIESFTVDRFLHGVLSAYEHATS